MDNDLVAAIKAHLQHGRDIQQILADLKQLGHSDAEINAAFKQAMTTSPTPPAESPGSHQAASLTKSLTEHLDMTKAFIFTGLVLVIAAVAAVLISLWSDLAPVVRILLIVGPMVALYGIAAATNNQEHHDVHEGTLVTASMIVPVAVGATLNQVGLIAEFNSLLIGLSSLVGYLVFAFLEFGTNRRALAPVTLLLLYLSLINFMLYWELDASLMYSVLLFISLTIGLIGLSMTQAEQSDGRIHLAVGVIGLYLFLAGLLLNLQVDYTVIIWSWFFVSAIVFLLGTTMLRHKMEDGNGYVVVGSFLGSLIAPAAVLASLNKELALPLEINCLIVALFAPLYIGMAMVLDRLSHQFGRSAVLYQGKRFLEEIAPVILLVPFLYAGYQSTGYLLVAIFISFVLIYANVSVPLRSLLPVGTIGLIVGIVAIAAKLFADALGLPILILLAGFALIGLSFMIKRMSDWRKDHPTPPFHGIGIDPEVEQQFKTSMPKQSGCLQAIIWLVVLFVLLPWVFWAVMGGLF